MLRAAGSNGIAVGIEGWYDALQPIIRSYGVYATRIYFPYPAPLLVGSAPQGPAMMAMTFNRAGLARSAASIRRPELDSHPTMSPQTAER